MGPKQLAGVMSIVAPLAGGVARASRSTRRPTRRCAALVEDQIERESLALFTTGRL